MLGPKIFISDSSNKMVMKRTAARIIRLMPLIYDVVLGGGVFLSALLFEACKKKLKYI